MRDFRKCLTGPAHAVYMGACYGDREHIFTYCSSIGDNHQEGLRHAQPRTQDAWFPPATKGMPT